MNFIHCINCLLNIQLAISTENNELLKNNLLKRVSRLITYCNKSFLFLYYLKFIYSYILFDILTNWHLKKVNKIYKLYRDFAKVPVYFCQQLFRFDCLL